MEIVDLLSQLNIHCASTDDIATLDNAKFSARMHLLTGTSTLEGVDEMTFSSTSIPSNTEIITFFQNYENSGTPEVLGETVEWQIVRVAVHNNDLVAITPTESEPSGWGHDLISGQYRTCIELNVYDRFQDTLGYSDYSGTSYSFNGKIFDSRTSALAYAQTGDTSGQIYRYTPPTNFNDFLYIHETRYRLGSDGSKTKISEIFTEYRTLGNSTLVLVGGDYSNGNYFLRYNGSRIDVHDMLTDSWNYASSSLAQYYYYDSGTYNYSEGAIISSLQTNIPKVNNNDDYNEYLNTGDTSLITNYQDIFNNLTGDELTETELASTRCGSPFISIYLLSLEELAKIGSWLYREDTRALFESCLWGDKPIEMVVDVNWTPLTMSQFALVTSVQDVKFGDVVCTDVDTAFTTPRTATVTHDSYGNNVQLCDTIIMGSYNDWRDYECSYRLYLPYYGMIDLDPRIIIGANLKVECNYFMTSKVLKHYVFINNILYGEYECTLGCSIALSSVDQASKARENISAFSNIIGGAISYGVGAELGIPQNMVGGVSSIIEGIAASQRTASHELWGNNSSTGNSNDIPYCYLIIESPSYIVPNNLHVLYNYPSYFISQLSQCSGYTEVKDVRLQGCSTYSDDEKEQIKSILRGGVIL